MIDTYCAYQTMRSFSPATVQRRSKTLNQFARYIAPAGFAEVTPGMIEAWLATKNAPRTRRSYRADLKAFYGWAVRRDLLERNPVDRTEQVRVDRLLPRPIDDATVVVRSGRMRTRQMAGLGLFAGLRCAEIANLRGEDVDIAHGVLVVRHGKGGKDRVIPLHPELVALLDGVPARGYLFTYQGQPIRPGTVSRTLRDHLRRCGIEATAHQLRHTFGTELARQLGGNLLPVARLMGHSSTETTKGYTAWVADGADEVARMFAA